MAHVLHTSHFLQARFLPLVESDALHLPLGQMEQSLFPPMRERWHEALCTLTVGQISFPLGLILIALC